MPSNLPNAVNPQLLRLIIKNNLEIKSFEMITEESSNFSEIYIKGQTYKDVLSKRDLWKELERLYNGTLKLSTTKSGDIATLTLEIQYKNYKIVLKESDTQPLNVETNIKLTTQYEFNIYLRDWTDKISSLFGIKTTKTGKNEFDTKYVIQSKEFELTMKILNDNYIIEKIIENGIYSLILNYDQTTRTHKLLTVKDRNTKEIKAMTDLIDLEFRVLDSFIKHGHIL